LYAFIASCCDFDISDHLGIVITFLILIIVSLGLTGFSLWFSDRHPIIAVIPLLVTLILFICTIVYGVRTIPSLLYLFFIAVPKALIDSGKNKIIACLLGFPLGIIAALPCTALGALIIFVVFHILRVAGPWLLVLGIAALFSGGINILVIIFFL
jgi:hypothetical protein